MAYYNFDDQITTYYNNNGLFITDNDTFTFGAWTNIPATSTYYRYINTSANGQVIIESCVSGTGPFHVSTGFGVSPIFSLPTIIFGISSYIITPTYADTAAYIASGNPPPTFASTDFLFPVGSYFIIDRTFSAGFGGTARAATQFQPAQAIIIYNPTGSGENVDADLSQTGNDIVLAVPGANPTVASTLVFDTIYTNNINVTGPDSWLICSTSVVDPGNDLHTTNNGWFFVDTFGNLIYKWGTAPVSQSKLPPIKLQPKSNKKPQPRILSILDKLKIGYNANDFIL